MLVGYREKRDMCVSIAVTTKIQNCVIPSLSVISTDAVLGYPRVTLSEADIIATENDSMDSTMLSSVMEMVRHCVEPVAVIGPSETDTVSDTPKSPGERERESR